MNLSDATPIEAARLPVVSLRDRVNKFRQSFKFKWVPFRGYYRYRSYKYMRRVDLEMGLLRFLMNPEKISLDVGANLGLFTYFLARYSKHVHAFEPNPLAFDVLRCVADNNVTLYPQAVTDRATEVEFFVPRNRKGWSSNGGSLNRPREGHYALVRTRGCRIDDLNLAPIGFIKIDVEGHEASVLRGAVATLRRDRPTLFVEIEWAHVGDDLRQVFDLASTMGYDGFFLEDNVLTNIRHFSAEEHQIVPRSNPASRKRYVKNFIFIPR
jgi:FkbM family methyltransferase